MIIEYKSQKVEKLCCSITKAKKELNNPVAEKLISAINFIEAAQNLGDVINYPPFHFHQLKGEKKN